ncbi:MAG TPA: hypothetical protein VK970_26405, partial [Candidatus Methylacidiphilales bacterium]|nr:hypothetical protein [Candidatus Methylacidiphilales bacterium]
MKWFICFCSALMMSIAAAQATPPPDGMQLAKVEASGIQEVVVEHYTASNPTGPSRKEVWLAERENRDNRVFLFRHVRLAEVMIAPDQKHLVINNAYASNSSSLLVYQRVNGLEYKQVSDGKAISANISKALAQKLGYSVQDKLDHLYMRAEKWDGPGSLVVKVSGSGGKAQLDGASVSVTIPEIEVAVLNVPTQQQTAQADGGLPPAAAPSIQPGKSGKTSTASNGSGSAAPPAFVPAKKTTVAVTPTPPPAPAPATTPASEAPAPAPVPEQPKRPAVVVVPPVPPAPVHPNDPAR